MELVVPVKVDYTNVVVDNCNKHPTCEGCAFWKKHIGCYFRGKTPREWVIPEVFEREVDND